MPGKMPDPAESFDVVEVLRNVFTKDVTPALAAAVVEGQRQALKFESAPTFEVVSRAVTPGVPTVLIGADRTRVRALMRATVDEIYIGSLGQLQTGFGYPLPVQAGDEIKTTDDVYVLYAPTGTPDPLARVAVWIERNPQRG